MINCPNCNSENDEAFAFCQSCGAPLRPQQNPQQVYVPYPPQQEIPFRWLDICSIIGFVSSIVGFFWCAALLLPIGFVASLIGFFGKKLRALAAAGMILSVIGGLIRLCIVLYDMGLLPAWITGGVFW